MWFVSVLLFLIVFSSGSIFSCAFLNKKFEEALPITASAIIVISFIMGIIKLLKYSTIFICLIGLCLIVLSIIKVVKEKQTKIFFENLFTMGFVLFVFFAFFFIITLKGKLLNAWDEFSHWGDIVKIMTQLNDYGTNPLANAAFASYTPGMSLFQYFLQRINYFLTGIQMEEWLCNYAYSLLEVSVILPFVSRFNHKNKVIAFIFVVVLICVPFIFYDEQVFREIYIEPFISLLMASALLNTVWSSQRDQFNFISFCSILIMLVLAKDNGLLFAAFIGIAYVYLYYREVKETKPTTRIVLFTLLSVALPKLLWSLHLKLTNTVPAFEKKVDLIDFINIFLGKNNSYRKTALANYFKAFIDRGINIGNSNIFVNYVIVLILTLLFVYFISIILKEKNKKEKDKAYIVFICSVSICVVFFLGLIFVYLYKFVEIEALQVWCFNRYSRSVYFALWVYIIVSGLLIIDDNDFYKNFKYGMIVILILLCTPLSVVFEFCARNYVYTSIAIRDTYEEILDKTDKYIPEGSKVYFYSLKDSQYEKWYYRYCVRPTIVTNMEYPTIYDYETEDYSIRLTANQWMEELIKEDYQYVTIASLIDGFVDDYGSIFEKIEDIGENRIYKVDKNNKKLILCK